jgi:hypothetical protein
MTRIAKERTEAMLWDRSKHASEWPKDYLVIPVKYAVDIIEENEVDDA